MSRFIIVLTAILLCGSADAKFRPPYDPDVYYHNEQFHCVVPWMELIAPEKLQSACTFVDKDGKCVAPYTAEQAWFCPKPHEDNLIWYSTGNIVAMHLGGESYVTTGLGKGYPPLDEILPGWKFPSELAGNIRAGGIYRDEIIANVVDPCFLQYIRDSGLDSMGEENALLLLKTTQANEVEEMIEAVYPTLVGKEADMQKILYGVFTRRCIAHINRNQ